MLTVHHLNTSRSQRVLWLLEELGVPYQIERYDRDPKTMLAPASLTKVHPLGKSPVVTDGKATLAESGAILEYLVEQYGEGKFAPEHELSLEEFMPRKEGESSPAGYRMAAAMTLRSVLAEAQSMLLEPIMWLEVIAPDAFVGEVVGQLGAKGAKIENIIDRGGQKTVQAFAALRQLFGFSTSLRSGTQGRASFVMKFAKFDVLD